MSQGRDRHSAPVQGGLALGTIMLVVLASLAGPVRAAHAATTEFSSSFEATDRPLDWTSTAETDAQGNKKMSGVTGSSRSGIPGQHLRQDHRGHGQRREPAERDRRRRPSTAA